MKEIDILRKWRKSPLRYIYDVWKLKPQKINEPFKRGEHLTWQQALFFKQIEQGLKESQHVYVSVASGHGTGKSCNLSMLIFWALTCFVDAQVATTAPTSDQIYDVLWKELSIWHRKIPEKLRNLFDISSQYVRVKERPETWWARARTARKENPEALAGIHANTVVFIVDEASGVPEEIFEVAQGALTGKRVIFVMMSNPTRLNGYFFDSHHKNRDRWRTLTFNSEESPIVEGSYCKRMAEQYGADSPQYAVRVLGQFPDSEEDQLISRSLFDSAAERPKLRDKGEVRCLGVDVARYGGDKTVLTERQGVINVLKIRSGQDTVATANDVCAEIKKGVAENNPYDYVMVDVIGLGAGVFDTLKERVRMGVISDVTLLPINVAEVADNEKDYANKRVELAHRYRAWLKTGAVDERLRDESCAVKFGKPDAKGRNTLERKEDTKELIGHSPDMFDSATLTFAVNIRRDTKSKIGFKRKLLSIYPNKR